MGCQISKSSGMLNMACRVARLASMPFLLAAAPLSAFAEDTLTSVLPAPQITSHPYMVLGVAPGNSKLEAAETLAEYFDRNLEDEVVTLNVQSSNGRTFRLEYAQRLVSPWVTPFVRMGSDPYEEVNVSLATGVLDGRVLGVERVIVATGTDRPSAGSVFKQIEDAFGTPSLQHFDTYESEMIYAHAGGTLVHDLKAADPNPSAVGVGSSDYLSDGAPCKTAIGRSPIYKFRSPREGDWIGTCDLVFRITVQNSVANTTIRFSLIDYALTRANRDETDRQINEALQKTAPASEIKL